MDRLLAALEELQLIPKESSPAPVFIAYFDRERLHDYLRLAAHVRACGLGVEVYPEPKRLGQQLKYADQRGFRVALVAGEQEFSSGTCQVKDLRSRSSREVSLDEQATHVVAAIRAVLEHE